MPDRDSQPSYCFDNVTRVISKSGGAAVTGWAIWAVPGLYYEAEHHCVWRKPTGELVDVSPQTSPAGRIVFARDESATYDPLAFRSNVVKAASDKRLATEFAALATQRNKIQDAYRARGSGIVLLSVPDRVELARIERRLQEILVAWRGRYR